MIFIFQVAQAQRQGNIWYFGRKAGIDFNTGTPFALTDGAMSTFNGCATISDALGDLLFYTDGITVYDKTHQVMPHGINLAGGLTSTQSAIIIPKPLSTTLYYIFTVDYEMGDNGLEYSIVDITKNGGLGDVVTKNIKIKAHVCEKLTAVQTSNRLNFWVIAHDSSTNYLSYLVSDSGVRTIPVVSGGGVNVSSSIYNAIGYLKLSSGGNRLAGAVKFLNLVEIGNFDNKTGKVSDLQIIPNVNTAYGVEFSPDNSKLYATDYFDQQLFQFDLSSANISNIVSSKVVIYTSNSALGAIQQAPDGKIYVARDAQGQMGVINKPNQSGKACSYVDKGFDLSGKLCYSGLPTFVQSFFVDTTNFVAYNICFGEGTHFTVQTNLTLSSWHWDFGDPVSTKNNTDSVAAPIHYFTSPGVYVVKLVININGINDTITNSIVINKTPVINLGPDRITCVDTAMTLDAGNPGYIYSWNTRDTTEKITTDTSGLYKVRVTSRDGSCSSTDSVNITYKLKGNFKLKSDTSVCALKSLTLKPGMRGSDYVWSTGQTDSVITVSQSGTYIVHINLGTCTIQDSILVSFVTPPLLNIAHDSILCEGNIDSLDAGYQGMKYLWSTGDSVQKIGVHIAGTYWLKLTSGACVVFDTINILHCPAQVFIPSIFSPNGDHKNDIFQIKGTDIARAEMIITNRWGEIVYNGDALDSGWDGSFFGRLCPEDLYAYRLIYREYSGTILYDHQITGKIMLLR